MHLQSHGGWGQSPLKAGDTLEWLEEPGASLFMRLLSFLASLGGLSAGRSFSRVFGGVLPPEQVVQERRALTDSFRNCHGIPSAVFTGHSGHKSDQIQEGERSAPLLAGQWDVHSGGKGPMAMVEIGHHSNYSHSPHCSDEEIQVREKLAQHHKTTTSKWQKECADPGQSDRTSFAVLLLQLSRMEPWERSSVLLPVPLCDTE